MMVGQLSLLNFGLGLLHSAVCQAISPLGNLKFESVSLDCHLNLDEPII